MAIHLIGGHLGNTAVKSCFVRDHFAMDVATRDKIGLRSSEDWR